MRRSDRPRKRKGGARDRPAPARMRDQSGPRDPALPVGEKRFAGRSEPLPASTGNYGRELRELLAGIGAPKPAPLKPDPFQLQALAALESEDGLVAAPTGTGRTRIAPYANRRLQEFGMCRWQTIA